MSFLDHIAFCNRHDLTGFRRFLVDGQPVGWVAPGFAARLADFGAVFLVSDDAVEPAPGLGGVAVRTAAVDSTRTFLSRSRWNRDSWNRDRQVRLLWCE